MALDDTSTESSDTAARIWERRIRGTGVGRRWKRRGCRVSEGGRMRVRAVKTRRHSSQGDTLHTYTADDKPHPLVYTNKQPWHYALTVPDGCLAAYSFAIARQTSRPRQFPKMASWRAARCRVEGIMVRLTTKPNSANDAMIHQRFNLPPPPPPPAPPPTERKTRTLR